MRFVSRDDGRSWSEPEEVFTGGHPMLTRFSGGGLACAGGKGLFISYDKGRSWIQKDTYPDSTPLTLSDGALLVVGGRHHTKWTEEK